MNNIKWSLDDKGLLLFNNICIEDEPDDDTTHDNKRKLKVSDDGRYAVVYNIAQFYADFYCFDDVDEEPRYLFTKKRNSYRNDNFFIEFLKNPTNTDETFVIFNSRHGGLTVYYADTGNEKTDSQDDKFITSIKIINEKYMHLSCWYWQPVFCTYLYNIKDFLNNHDYNGVMIDSDFDVPDQPKHFKLNDDNMIEIFDNYDKYHQVYSLDDFYENHKIYKNRIESIHTSKQIKENKQNLLHKIFIGLDETHVSYENTAREKLCFILDGNDDHLIESSCIGNNSKQDLSYHINSIIKQNTYEDELLNFVVPKTLFHGFVTNLKQLPEINLRFTFKKQDVVLFMEVQQTMKKVTDAYECQIFEIDPDVPCYINFS